MGFEAAEDERRFAQGLVRANNQEWRPSGDPLLSQYQLPLPEPAIEADDSVLYYGLLDQSRYGELLDLTPEKPLESLQQAHTLWYGSQRAAARTAKALKADPDLQIASTAFRKESFVRMCTAALHSCVETLVNHVHGTAGVTDDMAQTELDWLNDQECQLPFELVCRMLGYAPGQTRHLRMAIVGTKLCRHYGCFGPLNIVRRLPS